MAEQFHFDPDTYLAMIRAEVPAYDRFQDALAACTRDLEAGRILDLGTGTGETAARVLALHPSATLVGIDESADMLAAARARVSGVDLRVARLQDALPEGPFDLAVSALAVHHLDGPGKADLFRRVHAALRPGGTFVLGDVVVPEDPGDAVTPLGEGYDLPSGVDEQLAWLDAAGFRAHLAWHERDLAVLVGDR